MRKLTRRSMLAGAGALAASQAKAVLFRAAPGVPSGAASITSVSLSNNTFTGGSPSGTVVGAISVVLSSGTFSGTLSLTGTNAASFQIVGSNLETNGVVANGTYSINIVATQVGLSNSPFTQPETITGASAPSGLTAEITFPGGSPVGGTLIFDQATATNMGDYVAPTAGFTQHCYRARNASLPHFFVDFRPDAAGGRVEVVFWNGETDPTTPANIASGYTRDLPAYNCVIKQNGTTIYTLSLPFHYWGARWRYQSATRSVIRTTSQVFSEGWLMSMSQAAARLSGYSGVIVPGPPNPVLTTNTLTGNPVWTPFDPPASSSTVATGTLTASAAAGDTTMVLSFSVGGHDNITVHLDNGHYQTFWVLADTTAGSPVSLDKAFAYSATSGASATSFSTDMGIPINNDTGGNHPEEGIITEWQADYLFFQGTHPHGDTAWNNLYQQAEMMAAQWNSHYLPDAQTGAPVNYYSDATRWASYTRNSRTGPYGSYYRIQGGGQNTIGNISGGIAEHGQNYFYIPYIFTEDPYYIEAMQYAHQDSHGFDIYHKENDIGHLATDPTGASCICGPRGIWAWMAEPRNIGWGLRNTAVAYKCSPATAPSWMLSQNPYAEAGFNQSKLIDVELTTSTNTFQTIYHNPCRFDYLQLFETSYWLMAVSLADRVGLPVISPNGNGSAPAWTTPLTFFFGQMTDVTAPYTGTTGTSGWNIQNPQITGTHNNAAFNFDNVANPSGYFHTYGDFWATVNGDTFYNAFSHPPPEYNQGASSVQNLSVMVAACGASKSRGVAAAPAAFTYLNSMIDASYPLADYGVPFEMRWAFDGT